ncbi:hypothetical protein [Paraburkholderia sp. MM6662-R1]|uniref:hypothetical protein n=1 Tax=Paraburkholderia sp. MM6662-R1 TaxID=2991066 RepID=UPI003D1DBAB7
MKNGQIRGKEYVDKLEAYLKEAHELPLSGRDGTLNLAELSRITGIPKCSFYQNPPLKTRLTEALQEQGVSRRGATAVEHAEPVAGETDESAIQRGRQSLERTIHQLEQKLAVAIEECSTLREENKALRLQLGREDMMIETGRRVASLDRL